MPLSAQQRGGCEEELAKEGPELRLQTNDTVSQMTDPIAGTYTDKHLTCREHQTTTNFIYYEMSKRTSLEKMSSWTYHPAKKGCISRKVMNNPTGWGEIVGTNIFDFFSLFLHMHAKFIICIPCTKVCASLCLSITLNMCIPKSEWFFLFVILWDCWV